MASREICVLCGEVVFFLHSIRLQDYNFCSSCEEAYEREIQEILTQFNLEIEPKGKNA